MSKFSQGRRRGNSTAPADEVGPTIAVSCVNNVPRISFSGGTVGIRTIFRLYYDFGLGWQQGEWAPIAQGYVDSELFGCVGEDNIMWRGRYESGGADPGPWSNEEPDLVYEI